GGVAVSAAFGEHANAFTEVSRALGRIPGFNDIPLPDPSLPVRVEDPAGARKTALWAIIEDTRLRLRGIADRRIDPDVAALFATSATATNPPMTPAGRIDFLSPARDQMADLSLTSRLVEALGASPMAGRVRLRIIDSGDHYMELVDGESSLVLDGIRWVEEG